MNIWCLQRRLRQKANSGGLNAWFSKGFRPPGVSNPNQPFNIGYEGKNLMSDGLHRDREEGWSPVHSAYTPVRSSRRNQSAQSRQSKIERNHSSLCEMGWSYCEIAREVGPHWTRAGQILMAYIQE